MEDDVEVFDVTNEQVTFIIGSLRCQERECKAGFMRWFKTHAAEAGSDEWNDRSKKLKDFIRKSTALRAKLGDTKPVK